MFELTLFITMVSLAFIVVSILVVATPPVFATIYHILQKIDEFLFMRDMKKKREKNEQDIKFMYDTNRQLRRLNGVGK